MMTKWTTWAVSGELCSALRLSAEIVFWLFLAVLKMIFLSVNYILCK